MLQKLKFSMVLLLLFVNEYDFTEDLNLTAYEKILEWKYSLNTNVRPQKSKLLTIK